ncbi:squalene/phytoene synthase family protein [Streptomyces sp. Je 1-79]|uniref:squalene/phytoene synthase family protein n=1 Tax=Streptomyces sp. Je 1-79 TaxID=2943847 RepID=UPI0021A86307|nr:squalene/phytoene synthase family protein [Streptomyces sp. Je 1-79]MCT4357882.1 squalene/phytoene synthase family protein [Streptomyces sp. Je 1-79]
MWRRSLDRAGIWEPRLRRDYTEQRRAVRRFATAEYTAARLLLPAALLPHVVAAVAFMHDTDDRIDRGEPDVRAAALVEWDGLVHKAFAEGASALPVLRCLVRTAERHPDVCAKVEEFLRGCEREVAWRAFADEEELEQYVREYSLPALMLTACLLAPADTTGRAAFTDGCHRLIRAMQRIDFLEDLADDVRAGRTGIPADAVARHGADLTRPDAALGRLVQEQVDRAATDLAAAAPLAVVVDPPYRPFIRALLGIQHLRLGAVRRAGASLATGSSAPPIPAAALLLLRETAARAGTGRGRGVGTAGTGPLRG